MISKIAILFISISLVLLCYNLGRLYAMFFDLKDEITYLKNKVKHNGN